MNNHGARETTRRYVRDANRRRKVVRTFDLNVPPVDLNVPPVEETLPEGATITSASLGSQGTNASVNSPPPVPQVAAPAAAPVVVLDSPIDVEAIEEEVLMLSSSEGFPQARNPSRRRRATVVIDEDLEIRAIRSRNIGPMGFTNGCNQRPRIAANKGIIDCEDYSINKRNIVTTAPEPAKASPKEPTFACAVCLNELTDSCSTTCGHVFCQVCIKMSVQKQKKCPTCRKPLTMKSFHRVYLPTAN